MGWESWLKIAGVVTGALAFYTQVVARVVNFVRDVQDLKDGLEEVRSELDRLLIQLGAKK